MTFAELDWASDRIATALEISGVKSGDRVGYLGVESVDFYALFFGCAKVGAVFVPINNRLARDEIAYILVHSGCRLLLCDTTIAYESPDVPSVISMVGGDLSEWYSRFPPTTPPTELRRRIAVDDAVIQLYTSGTTGRPKGVVLAHRSFFAVRLAMAESGYDWIDWRSDDVSLVGVPGCHIGGIWWVIQGLLAGVPTVTMPRFEPAAAVALVREWAVTMVCMVPAMLQWMLAEPTADPAGLASIRKIVYGGSSMPEKILAQAKSLTGCEFTQFYGLTETGNTAVCLSPEDHRIGGKRLRSVGRPYPGFAVKVIGSDGTVLPAGEIGEICLCTPAAMLGYYGDRPATEATLVDGWIHTGDAGYLDSDGYLYLGDRIKDLILVGSDHVYPAEVERVLCEHPAVIEAAVLGVPDEQFGELAYAVVVLDPAFDTKAGELLTFAGQRLAAHKVPATFEFAQSLPRNPSGKVLRRELRDRLNLKPASQARQPEPTVGEGSKTPVRDITDPMGLTATQAAYWIGRQSDLPLGGVAPWCYFEVDRIAADPFAEVLALQVAWNRLIAGHDVLRVALTGDGGLEIPSDRPEYRIAVIDLRQETAKGVDAALAELTAQKSHQVLDPACWPLFDIAAAILPDGGLRIFLGFDMIAMDVPSWALLMRHWRDLTADPEAECASVRTDAETAREPRNSEPDRAWWLARIPALPPGPKLPWAEPFDQLQGMRFQRHHTVFPVASWVQLRAACQARGLLPRAVLLAAYGLVLDRWSTGDPFCVNTVVFDRPDEALAGGMGDFSTTSITELPTWRDWGSFAELAQAVHDRLAADLAHREFSGIEVQQAMGPAAVPRYPVVFTDCTGLPATEPIAWLGEEVRGVSQTPQVALDCIVWDRSDGGLRFTWDAVDRAFPEQFVPRMLVAYERLLTCLSVDPGFWQRGDLGADPFFHSIAMLEQRPDCGPLLVDPQRRSASTDPDAIAITGAALTMTHGELAQRSDAMAAALLRCGVVPGDRVAVVAGRSAAQIVSCYAVSVAGATLVPLDPHWPAARIAAACGRAGVRHVLAATDCLESLPSSIMVHNLDRLFESDVVEAIPSSSAPSDSAYIIFTSGSTGEPKGVMIEHAAVRTTVDDINDRFGVGPADRVLALSAPTFDLSIYDVFGVLGAGGALVVPEADAALDPAAWTESIAEHRVTVWNTAPAVAQMLVEYAEDDPAALDRLASLRLMLLSGDWIPLSLPQRLQVMLPELQVVSLGGATEASIWSICYPIEQVDPSWRSIPYGLALREQFFVILDEAGDPCPLGVAGELHIGGAGLARGYVGDDEQTAYRFFRHPLSGERLYRTGDLGRWCSDGTIEFLGRVDRQLKVLGHRIEPGEIEAVVSSLPQIRQCLAVGQRGKDGQLRLVAYVVGRSEAVDLEAVVAHAREQLPSYLVPSRWMVLDELPLTPNGKIDHAALPDPFGTGDRHPNFTPASPGARRDDGGSSHEQVRRGAGEHSSRKHTGQERWVAALWGELLGTEITESDADFFALGGHSVLATRMLYRVRAAGYGDISLREIADHSTVAGFAQLLTERRRTEPEQLPAITHLYSGEPFPLTRVQHAYLIGRRSAGVACYIFHEFRCTELDLDRYEQAWNTVIARHPMLRTVITTDYHNKVLDSVPQYRIRRYDLTTLSAEQRASRLRQLRDQLSHRVIRHDRWPLFEVRAAVLGEAELRLFVGIDALICDASSFFLLDQHLRQAYADPTAQAPVSKTDFSEYVAYCRSRRDSTDYRRAAEYWKQRIPTLPGPPMLPTRLKAEGAPRFIRRSDRLTVGQWETLCTTAAQYKLTPSAVLLTVYADALAELSGEDRFSIMLTLMDRPPELPGIDEVVGEFTALVAHEVDRRGDRSFLARARLTQRQLFEDLDHREYSAVEVLTELTARAGARVQLPAVFTSGLDIGELIGSGPQLEWVGPIEYGISQTPDVWLDHQVLVTDGELQVRWDVSSTMVDGAAADSGFATMMRSLRRLADTPAAWNTGDTVPASITDVAAEVTALWAELLGVDIDALDMTRGFVASGGDSVSAVQLARQVRGAFGFHLRIDEVIAPEFTLEVLISRIDYETIDAGSLTGSVTDLIEYAADTGPFELTPLQQAYWVGQHDAWSLSYRSAHGYADLRLSGLTDFELETAVRRLVDRNPMLRTVFADGTQEVLDRTDPQLAELPVTEIDLSSVPQSVVTEEIRRIRAELQSLGPGPQPWSFRIVTVRMPDGEVSLHIACSLLIADGWSGYLLVSELLTYLDEPNAVLPGQNIRFADYVATLAARRHTAEWAQHRRWWFERLDQLPPAPELPLAAQADQLHVEMMQRREFHLTARQFETLTTRCTEYGIIPSAVFATCYAIALANAADHRHFLLNVLYLDRMALPADLDPVIGPFATTALVELRLPRVATFAELCRRTQSATAQTFDHALLSGVEVAREIGRRRHDTRPPAPVVFHSTLGLHPPAEMPEAIRVLDSFHSIRTPQVTLDLQVGAVPWKENEVVVTLDAVVELFEPGVVDAIFDETCSLLERLTSAAQAWDFGISLPEFEVPESSGARPPVLLSGCEPLATQTEKLVGELWAELLTESSDPGAAQYHRSTDFFQVGGTSVTAIAMLKQVRDKTTATIRPRQFLSNPTIGAFAAAIDLETDWA